MMRIATFPPLLVLLLLAGPACGTASSTPTPSAIQSAATATAQPPSTPVSPPGAGLPNATPAFVTPGPGATDGPRTDCPQTWVPFVNQSGTLSLCAPEGTIAVADVNELGEPGITLGSDLGGEVNHDLPMFAVAVRLSSGAIIPQGVELSSHCANTADGGKPATLVTAEGDAVGCDATVEPNSSAGPLETLRLTAKLAVPSDTGLDLVNFNVNWRLQSAGAEDIAKGIAATVRVER